MTQHDIGMILQTIGAALVILSAIISWIIRKDDVDG